MLVFRKANKMLAINASETALLHNLTRSAELMASALSRGELVISDLFQPPYASASKPARQCRGLLPRRAREWHPTRQYPACNR